MQGQKIYTISLLNYEVIFTLGQADVKRLGHKKYGSNQILGLSDKAWTR